MNGVKREYSGEKEGYFGVVNLLGPRAPLQRPFDQFWNDHFTYVQLRFDFVDKMDAPLLIERSFITFYVRSPAAHTRPAEP